MKRKRSFKPITRKDYERNKKAWGHDYFTLCELQAILNLKRYPSEERFERFINARGIRSRYRRNYPLLNTFFGDFVWPSIKLVIEIDGKSHADRVNYDRWRDKLISEQGFEILRVPASYCDQWEAAATIVKKRISDKRAAWYAAIGLVPR